jgi:hypothetical protein
MKHIKYLILLLLLLSGCTTTTKDNSKRLEKYFVGEWEWEQGRADCKEYVSMAFRGNGTHTRTSSSCDIEDDGFGIFTYGWFVANNHLCFVHIEEQYKDEKPRKDLYKKLFLEQVDKGFNKAICYWKIEQIERNRITITYIIDENNPVEFTMIRKRWLREWFL